MDNLNFDRSIKFYGSEGREKLERAHLLIAGVGGIGNIVALHASILFPGEVTLIEPEVYEPTNTNRYFFPPARVGELKVDLAEELMLFLRGGLKINKIPHDISHPKAQEAIKKASWVIGCFDNEAARLKLIEITRKHKVHYLDLATGIDVSDPDAPAHGGRVFYQDPNVKGCLLCCNLIDADELQEQNMNDHEKAQKRELYGVPIDEVNDGGPAVSTLNGIIATHAVHSAMLAITEVRKPSRFREYNGVFDIYTEKAPENWKSCFYCDD